MKLILANNQSEKFRSFYSELSSSSQEPFDYAGYSSLLFNFDSSIYVTNLDNGKSLSDYSGVYINGYLNTYELAAATAISCKALNIGFTNSEFSSPPSLSKLSMYAKLAANSVSIPKSIGGTKKALLKAADQLKQFKYPAVLKRADADRGIDNFKVDRTDDIANLLEPQEDRSLWILQEFISNNGFYLLSFYNDELAFCIYRTLEERPDGNRTKAHMYKPKGGINASLIDKDKVPTPLTSEAKKAVKAMNREIASVDCLYDQTTQKVYVLEVNYNPQLVSIETFKEERTKAFLENIKNIGTSTSKNL